MPCTPIHMCMAQITVSWEQHQRPGTGIQEQPLTSRATPFTPNGGPFQTQQTQQAQANVPGVLTHGGHGHTP